MNNPPLCFPTRRFAGLLPLLAWLVVSVFLPEHLQAAYKYPIGIPNAWIDPDVERPARPDPWTAEVPGYYFVNNTTGTDTGRPYGTPSAPRKTIPWQLGPGTYCEIQGTYLTNGGGWTKFTANGSAGPWVANTSGPAWVVGADAENRASLGAAALILGKYLCMEYIDNLAGNKIFQISSTNSTLGFEANHMLIRHCEIFGGNGAATTALSINNNANGPAAHIVVYANKVHGFGPDTPANVDIDANGVMATGGCKHIWVLDNEIYDMSGSGVAVSAVPAGPSTTSYIFVGRNHVYDTWAAGIAAKTSDHVVFSENLIHDIEWTSWSQAKCIGAQYALESLWILYNHCYNGDLGIKVGGGAGPNEMNIYVIGNLIHDIYDVPAAINPNPPARNGYYGAITLWSGNKRIIVGNTIVDCHNGIVFPAANVDHPYSAVVENNIVSNILANHLEVDMIPSASKWRNNLLFQNDRRVNLKFGGDLSVDQANALDFVSGLIEADPQFRDPANKDFSIASGSRAEDAALPATGLTFDVYAAYLADFGVPINVDIAGRTRPAGAGWDIGAYEGSSAKSRIPKPFGLDVKPEK